MIVFLCFMRGDGQVECSCTSDSEDPQERQEQSLRGNDMPLYCPICIERAMITCPLQPPLIACENVVVQPILYRLRTDSNRFPRLHRTMFSLHPIFVLFLMPLAGLATPINRPAILYRVINPFPCQDASPITYRCWRQYGYHLTFRLTRLHTCCQKLEHESLPTDRHPRHHHSVRQPSH